MRVSVVVVHYQTPELVVPAVENLALSRGLEALEILLVDNSGESEVEAIVDDLASRTPEWVRLKLLKSGYNLGYAGAANQGVRAATEPILVLMNCDVLVDSECLSTLASELATTSTEIVGPAFYWDEERDFVQPPAESWDAEYLEKATAARRDGTPGGAAAESARDAWRRHAWRHWQANRPMPSWSLSGALLGFRRMAWEAVGPFDEGYRLYFEETDWLLRARRLGVEARYVPQARAVHLYDQSARRNPQARQWFEESAQRCRERHLPRRTKRRLARLRDAETETARAPELFEESVSDRDLRELIESHGRCFLEVSPSILGFPAARTELDPDGQLTLPEPVRKRHADQVFWGRIVDEERRECAGPLLVGSDPVKHEPGHTGPTTVDCQR